MSKYGTSTAVITAFVQENFLPRTTHDGNFQRVNDFLKLEGSEIAFAYDNNLILIEVRKRGVYTYGLAYDTIGKIKRVIKDAGKITAPFFINPRRGVRINDIIIRTVGVLIIEVDNKGRILFEYKGLKYLSRTRGATFVITQQSDECSSVNDALIERVPLSIINKATKNNTPIYSIGELYMTPMAVNKDQAIAIYSSLEQKISISSNLFVYGATRGVKSKDNEWVLSGTINSTHDRSIMFSRYNSPIIMEAELETPSNRFVDISVLSNQYFLYIQDFPYEAPKES